MNLPTFPTFDLTEKDTFKTRWNKQVKRFNTLCRSTGVNNDGQKLSVLVTYIGDEMYGNYEHIVTKEISALTQVNADLEPHLHRLQILLVNVNLPAN